MRQSHSFLKASLTSFPSTELEARIHPPLFEKTSSPPLTTHRSTSRLLLSILSVFQAPWGEPGRTSSQNAAASHLQWLRRASHKVPRLLCCSLCCCKTVYCFPDSSHRGPLQTHERHNKIPRRLHSEAPESKTFSLASRLSPLGLNGENFPDCPSHNRGFASKKPLLSTKKLNVCVQVNTVELQALGLELKRV